MTAQAAAERANVKMNYNNTTALGIEESTPLAMMTLGQLLDALELRKPASAQGEGLKHYVYGLRGIQDLFGVSHKTAQQYKNSWLSSACMQSGRKIVVDADRAIQLFKERRVL